MSERYRVRPGSGGFMVYDAATGRTAFVQGRPQLGLSEARAEAVADSLNERRVTLGFQPLPPDLQRRTVR
jgi:hypothetical protein